ncbi:MAG TPA: MYXO-CTERM sorting domain-containing protein [Polyangiaceae bacterium]|nr:MYXO-CTERM sorting domain-containing protein [Polyangiaceae bacterium]
MHRRFFFHASLIAVALLGAPIAARADVVPDQCLMGAEGQPCQNALSGSRAGVCRTSTCTRANPPPASCLGDAGAGGRGTAGDSAGCGNYGQTSYECLRCMPGGSGGGGAHAGGGVGAAAGASGTGADTSGGTAGEASGQTGNTTGCDCRVGGDRPDGLLAVAMLVVGGTALFVSRRRRAQNRRP